MGFGGAISEPVWTLCPSLQANFSALLDDLGAARVARSDATCEAFDTNTVFPGASELVSLKTPLWLGAVMDH